MHFEFYLNINMHACKDFSTGYLKECKLMPSHNTLPKASRFSLDPFHAMYRPLTESIVVLDR